MEAPAIITNVPKSFLEEFQDHLDAELPVEKAQVELRQQSLARIMAAEGSVRTRTGLGQVVARIDPRLYFRLRREAKDVSDHEWIMDYLADNPMLCAKGFKPKSDPARRGFTFVKGKPVSINKGRVQT